LFVERSSNKVKYDVVKNYQELLNILGR